MEYPMRWSAAGLLALFLFPVLTGCESGRGGSKLPGPLLTTQRPVRPRPTLAPPPPLRDTGAAKVIVKPQPSDDGPVDLSDILPPRGGLWETIVVHHSEKANATPDGMHKYHLSRGWENGLGYHFVIGNGLGYPDGKVYMGPRWRKQQTGAHCAAGAGRYFGVRRPDNFFNEHGVGICLIGDFETGGRPTARQMATLEALCSYLCNTAGINPNRIYGHGQITGKTACPGRLMEDRLSQLRSNVARNIAWGPLEEEFYAENTALALAFAMNVERSAAPLSANLGLDEQLPASAQADLYSAVLAAHAGAEGCQVADGRVGYFLDDVADTYAGTLRCAVLVHFDHHDP
jgi:N-acetylmuramoyl-L-alanine amidase